MKRTFACALVLTAAVGVSSPAAGGPVWTVRKKTGDAWLNVVEVVGQGDTWFFDDSPEPLRPVVAYHWNVRKITKVPLPKEIRWGFDDADDGWAVARRGYWRSPTILAHGRPADRRSSIRQSPMGSGQDRYSVT